MHLAVLVKQVPRAESMALGPDGRLRRHGVELEMNAYCRRAVAKGVELARATGGRCVVFTLGPPPAEEVLREAIAWGADEGVLVSDPAFAGSDTLATARALAAALTKVGSWDLVLVGRNSIDADTGQVGPELAEMLGLPFVGAVRELTVIGADVARAFAGGSTGTGVAGTATAGAGVVGAVDGTGGSAATAQMAVEARCELDDGWRRVRVGLPAVLSVAERLTEPCKVPPEGRVAVPAAAIRTMRAPDLGPGPWGQAASPTSVGPVRVVELARRRMRLEGPAAVQVADAVRLLRTWGALVPTGVPATSDRRTAGNAHTSGDDAVPSGAVPGTGPAVVVVLEPGRQRLARELLGEAAFVARELGGHVVAAGPAPAELPTLTAWGADGVVELAGTVVEEDVARALVRWCSGAQPWAVIVPGTVWGREVAGRTAAALGAGLTGDAVGLGVEDGRLVAWKPAFGGQLVAAITASSPVQMVTVRPGVLPLRRTRPELPGAPVHRVHGAPAGRVLVLEERRDDEVEALLSARRVVGVGLGVAPDEYGQLVPLLEALSAELAATRKVTDRGWLPRARQVGITGHSIVPALYVAIGVAGRFNHMVGVRGAGTVVAINHDPQAPVFDAADVGICADWHEVVPALTAALTGAGEHHLSDPVAPV